MNADELYDLVQKGTLIGLKTGLFGLRGYNLPLLQRFNFLFECSYLVFE